MDGRDLRRQLVDLLGTRKIVCLTREFPGEPLHGFVLALGREWVLLQQFHDFYPEGYAALRVRDITDVRSGEHERHWERMFAAEGLLDQIAVPGALSLDETSQLLTALQRRGQNVIVECEENVEFHIGQILSVDAGAVCFANFDALGRWDDAPQVIRFRMITKVQFETPYVQTFSRYLEGPCRQIKRSGREGKRRERARAVTKHSKDVTNLELSRLVGTWKKVRLTRGFASEPLHNGFVLALGREWVLLQQFHDFYPEGYTALRVRDITNVRAGEYERHWERMFAAEGLLDQIGVPGALPLDETSRMLTALQQRDQNVIVECEHSDEDMEEFHIGQILSVDAGSVGFANFDALGRWDDAPHVIPLRKITTVQFETPYVRTFSRYLEGPYHQIKRSGRT